MNNLIHRSCSNCIYWHDVKVIRNGLVEAICEKEELKYTQGSNKCGQWKKLKYYYSIIYDEMEKDYR